MSNILQHHGIKGMRWGVRRSRPSGSGGSVLSKVKKASTDQMEKTKSAADEAHKISKEGVSITKAIGSARKARRGEDLSKLSDAELKSRIDRMALEQRYSTLTGSQVSKGEVYARSALEVTVVSWL